MRDTPQEVPETGFGDNLVWRKNTHAINLGGGIGFCGQVTANNLVLRDGHLHYPSELFASKITRNTDVCGDSLDDDGVWSAGGEAVYGGWLDVQMVPTLTPPR